MHWRTHAVIGANAIWLAVVVHPVDQSALLLLAAGGVSGLLPDIDATAAKIHFTAGGVFGPLRGFFRHRGFFHSLLAVALVALVSGLCLTRYHPALPLVVTLGYLSHPLIDGFNRPGVEYLFPWKKRLRLLPKALTTPVKGLADQVLFVVGLMGLIYFLISHFEVLTLMN